MFCSYGGFTRHAVWLQNVSGKRDEKMRISAGSLVHKIHYVSFVSKPPVSISLTPCPWDGCPWTTSHQRSRSARHQGVALGGLNSAQSTAHGPSGFSGVQVQCSKNSCSKQRLKESDVFVGVRGMFSRNTAFNSASFHHFHDFTEE